MKRKQFSKETRKTVYDSCGGHCAYCGEEINIRDMQVDHVIPFDMAEAYEAIGYDLNCADNLLPACRSCNHYKSTYTVEKFRAAIERYNDVLIRDSVTFRNAVRFGQVIQNKTPVVFYFERIGVKKNLQLPENNSESKCMDISCMECKLFTDCKKRIELS